MTRNLKNNVAGLCLSLLTAGLCAQQAEARPPHPGSTLPASVIRVEPHLLADAGSTYEYKAGGVQFTVPDGWRDEEQGDGTILVGPQDGSLVVIVWAPAEQDINKAADTVDAILGQFVNDVEVDTVEDIKESNGMRTLAVSGSGTSSGKACDFTAQFVQGAKLVVFLTLADSATLEQHQESLNELDDSITRM